MPIAEAHVRAGRPSRYLAQLCRHADHMGRMRHQPPSRDTSGRQPPVVRHVDFSENRGVIDFAKGKCTLQASADILTIRVEAADEDSLRQLQDGIAGRLEKIGRRDQLAVTWQRPDASTGRRGEQAPGAPPAPPSGSRKRWRLGLGTIALVVAGVLVVAVHLGLGGAALAHSAWTGWATNIVLALILLKLLSIAGHVLLGGLVVRHSKIAHSHWKLRHSPPEPTPPTEHGEPS